MSSNSETPQQEISRLLKQIGGKAGSGENMETLIGRAARRTGLHTSKARAYWYEEAAVVHSMHMDAARTAAGVSAVDEAIIAVQRMAAVANDMLGRLPWPAFRPVNFSAPRHAFSAALT